MATIVFPQRFACRRDTAANWAAVNPVLWIGEIGIESDTNKFKIGDGVTAWNDLPYFGAETGQFLFAQGDRATPVALGLKALVPTMHAGVITGCQMHIVTDDGLAGSAVVDIRKCSFADFSASRPSVADSITSTSPPTVGSALASQDFTLAGWIKDYAAGDVFVANLVSRSTNVVYIAVALSNRKPS